MTPRERARLAIARSIDSDGQTANTGQAIATVLETEIELQINEAVEAERQRCHVLWQEHVDAIVVARASEQPQPAPGSPAPWWVHALWIFAAVQVVLFVMAHTYPARAAETLIVIDGDTVWHRACPACPLEKIRLESIDAPEIHRARCPAERVAGLRARARLVALTQGRSLAIARGAPDGRLTDRYGRTLARITTDQGDVAQQLMAEGLALPWAPGKSAADARHRHWCGEE
jgi:endonuclease YncB( thermonuclease family)